MGRVRSIQYQYCHRVDWIIYPSHCLVVVSLSVYLRILTRRQKPEKVVKMINMFLFKSLVLTLSASLAVMSLLVHGQTEGSDTEYPRGIHPDLSPFYVYRESFQCVDGSTSIPFDQVNDDYCDCEDGSDEPGTSACQKGTFYCSNVGHAPRILVSSRVNDGICDCCDGSDEWAMEKNLCTNTCEELGREARIRAEKEAVIQKEGFAIKQALIKEGKEKKAQRMAEIEKLQKELEVAQDLQLKKEEIKLNAEELEKEALDKVNAEKERINAELEEQKKQKDNEMAMEIFQELDVDQDKHLTKAEMLQSPRFDQNKDGTVTEEEVQFFLVGNEEYSEEDFLNTGWPMMKPHVVPDDHHEQLTEEDTLEAPGDSEVVQELEEEEKDYDYRDEHSEEQEEEEEEEDYEHIDEEDDVRYKPGDEDKPPKPRHRKHKKPDHGQEYDEETQRLVDVAEEARSQFEDVRREVKDIEDKIEGLKKSLEKDYGPEEEYTALADKCFEFHETEYTYKICLFDYCSQKPNNGGGETRLGSWNRWENGVMHFTGGQTCWNGPARSTKVEVRCNTETKLIAVSEPSKCEYHMVLEVPAACGGPKKASDIVHDEL